MLAAIGPADYNYEETLSTLRYANRAKNIKNKPKVNENPKDAKLREMQDEIEILRKQLQDAMGSDFNMGSMGFGGMDNADGAGGKIEKFNKMDDELEKEQNELDDKLEKQRAKIMASKEFDAKRKEELMLKVKAKHDAEEEIRQKKLRMIEQLKEKENKIQVGQKKNEDELKSYNQAMDDIQAKLKKKKDYQFKMQKEIADNIMLQGELEGCLEVDKIKVTDKAKDLAKVKSVLVQKRDEYEELLESNKEECSEVVHLFFDKNNINRPRS